MFFGKLFVLLHFLKQLKGANSFFYLLFKHFLEFHHHLVQPPHN